jgi:hypothetical protein
MLQHIWYHRQKVQTSRLVSAQVSGPLVSLQ